MNVNLDDLLAEIGKLHMEAAVLRKQVVMLQTQLSAAVQHCAAAGEKNGDRPIQPVISDGGAESPG